MRKVEARDQIQADITVYRTADDRIGRNFGQKLQQISDLPVSLFLFGHGRTPFLNLLTEPGALPGRSG
jgi:hypothetical protein